jgi:hypothetical protein
MPEQPSEIVTRPRRPLLRRTAASRYLLEEWGIERKPSTLAKLAVIGGGPPFYKAGRIPLHDPDDLDEWAAELLGDARRSTSDAPRGGADPGERGDRRDAGAHSPDSARI